MRSRRRHPSRVLLHDDRIEQLFVRDRRRRVPELAVRERREQRKGPRVPRPRSSMHPQLAIPANRAQFAYCWMKRTMSATVCVWLSFATSLLPSARRICTCVVGALASTSIVAAAPAAGTAADTAAAAEADDAPSPGMILT
mgnify:CR=1 FL=1